MDDGDVKGNSKPSSNAGSDGETNSSLFVASCWTCFLFLNVNSLRGCGIAKAMGGPGCKFAPVFGFNNELENASLGALRVFVVNSSLDANWK